MTEEIICHSCAAIFENYKELAQHIISLKDTNHKKGKRWAHKFLMKQKLLDQKRDLKPRTPMPESVKSHFDEIKRETSGEMVRVPTVCPNCKSINQALVEKEFVDDGQMWTKDNRVVILCGACRK